MVVMTTVRVRIKNNCCRRSCVSVEIMSCERDLEETVNAFMLNTCRLCPQPSEHGILKALICVAFAALRLDDPDEEIIPLITGSTAELCIVPMLSCLGDIDLMYHSNTELAIPRGHPPPTQLPAEFKNYVKVFEIIDSHLPGYVYLELRYLLTERRDDGNFNSVEYDREQYFSCAADVSTRASIHGPATYYPLEELLSLDVVYCVRCLSWPLQAADWPSRYRKYGWPDSAILDRVVSNGCDMVRVAHRQCRQDEWMGKHQWRMSFSRAEIVLINRWMPVQQIVYHMLRHFVKTERLTDCADNSGAGTLSNYHIKTLMLWACELKPRSWWTENLNLV